MLISAAQSSPTRISSFLLPMFCPWHLLAGSEPAFCWQDGPEGDVWFAVGWAREFPTLEACRRALELIEAPPEISPRGFALVAFDPNQPMRRPWQAFPTKKIVLPRVLVRWREGEATCLTFGSGGAAEVSNLLSSGDSSDFAPHDSDLVERSLFARGKWRQAVRTVQMDIARGSLQKVVLSRQVVLSADHSLDPAFVLKNLSDRAAASILFAYSQPSGGVFLGATPERLFQLRKNQIAVDSLAGTRPRGSDPKEDEQLAQELSQSPKDRHEQMLVTQHIVSSLQPLCKNLQADGLPHVRKFSTVQHLYSSVEGELLPSATSDDLLNALHPTPATCGLPVAPSRKMIAQLEPDPRGLYAGVIGWVSADEAEFAVMIRSGLIRGKTARLFGGAGIVTDSEPDTEYDECEWKMEPLRRAL